MYNIFDNDDQSVNSISLDEIVDRELARSAIYEEVEEEEEDRTAEIALHLLAEPINAVFGIGAVDFKMRGPAGFVPGQADGRSGKRLRADAVRGIRTGIKVQ